MGPSRVITLVGCLRLWPDAVALMRIVVQSLIRKHCAAGYTCLSATAVSADGRVATASCALTGGSPPQEQPVIDLRSAHPQTGTALLTRSQRIHALLPGDTLRINDITNAKMNTVDSAARVYALFAELLAAPSFTDGGSAHPSGTAHEALWAEFSFLPEWASLDVAAKRGHLASHPCLELWYFIKVADASFFGDEVRPQLAQRLACERGAMMHLLLDDTAAMRATAASPQRMALLTGVERLLLACALDQTAAIAHLTLEARTAGASDPPTPEELARCGFFRFCARFLRSFSALVFAAVVARGVHVLQLRAILAAWLHRAPASTDLAVNRVVGECYHKGRRVSEPSECCEACMLAWHLIPSTHGL